MGILDTLKGMVGLGGKEAAVSDPNTVTALVGENSTTFKLPDGSALQVGGWLDPDKPDLGLSEQANKSLRKVMSEFSAACGENPVQCLNVQEAEKRGPPPTPRNPANSERPSVGVRGTDVKVA